ncbi:glycosyltransferase family 2 protein [Leptospira sp. GIMC2001]|uniref:glycosyltransferase family 2 protein n=1 Tax=Leptospira sp. GIMC2001 TaxID=1513297 RepID=UPI00234AC9DD|nr:glycosyltransferase family A protein [Leptospira sp. GIMC2001]WCL48037.1 glycosyltransferase family A protein [Leptospira sp. GIMC2001]
MKTQPDNSFSLSSSVIIPSFNRAHRLERCLQSVLKQTVLPTEIIIVNDGSTDDSRKFLDKLEIDIQTNSRFRSLSIKIFHTSNNGVSAARNLGIAKSSCEWIFFLDSDDEWLDEKIAIQLNFHKTYPNFKISQTQEKWIRREVFVNPRFKHKKVSGWIFAHSLELCSITPSSACIHRNVFEEVGGFDSNLLSCEDYDLWLAIASMYEVALIDQELLIRYGGELDQLSAKYKAMDRFRIYALLKRLPDFTSDQQLMALEILKTKLGILIEGRKKRNKDSNILMEILSNLNNKIQEDKNLKGSHIPIHWKKFLLNDENWE